MKKLLLLSSVLLICLGVNAQSVINVSGTIAASTTWTSNNQYLLQGFVYVKGGATLTIEPGTVIKGDKATDGTLIITRGCKIIADGTVANPIVFTSNEPMGERGLADWGGLIIAGNAKCNIPGGEGLFEGGLLDNADGDGRFGGLNDNDNSGILRYVRIEYGGTAYQPNNEVNGLTLGSVGRNTIIENVQVSFCGDDAFEFFGGTVNAKNLVSYRNLDDDFDCDFGYRGKLQFGLAYRDSAIADGVSGSNGFEIDNDAASTGNTPYTSPVISNFTIVGPKATLTNPINTNFKRGAHLRRNSRARIYNTMIIGFPKGLVVDGDSCHVAAAAGNLIFKNNILSGMGSNLDSVAGTWAISPWFNGSSNSIFANNTTLLLQDAFNYAAPNATPLSGSPALLGASFADADLATGFDVVAFKGALGATNWTSGWTNYNPQNTAYSLVGINDFDSNLKLEAYPNPAHNLLNVSINYPQSSEVSIALYDAIGGLVASPIVTAVSSFTTSVELNVSNLSAGLYFVRVADTNNNTLSTMKVVKK